MLPIPLLFAFLPAAPLAAAQHPESEEAFAAALGIDEAHLLRGAGLEIWCEDKKDARLLEKEVPAAWELADSWLPGLPMPAELPARVVVLHVQESLRRYLAIVTEQAAALTTVAPSKEWGEAVEQVGSGMWSYPPLVLLFRKALPEKELASRAVHDLAGLRIRYAASEYGAEPPEFLKEGFAGMLLRRGLKKPVPLVSHGRAALSSTIHGYGVFRGIGAAMNDGSNDPRRWPEILEGAAKQMRKEKEIAPESRIDQLLLRTAETFARADYAYSWAAVEFLFDRHLPYGAQAVEAAADRRWKPSKEPLPASRHSVVIHALEALRDPDLSGLDAAARAELLRRNLLQGYDESPAELHGAFLVWVERVMPRK